MTTKLAKDLKLNDKFMQEESKAWQVMGEPIKHGTQPIIKVLCYNTGSGETRQFEFGNNVRLSIQT